MKTLTCSDLAGPCGFEIKGETLEEIGKKCQAHVMEQVQKGDEAHLGAVEKWKSMTEEDQKKQMEDFEKKFNEATES